MKNSIEAALFDVDGTLLDTREFVYQAYDHSLKKHGIIYVSRGDIDKLMGKPLEECYKNLTGSEDIETLCEDHRLFQIENLELSRPFPNSKITLKRLRESGIKTAAITTCSQRTSIRTLELAGIVDDIDVVISGEDGTKSKPHPEPLFRALEKLEIKPGKAVMVGDTDVDILAGKNAKTKTIGVTYGFHGKKIAESNPDYVVDDISEIIPIILVQLKF